MPKKRKTARRTRARRTRATPYASQATCLRVGRHLLKVLAKSGSPEERRAATEMKPAFEKKIKQACVTANLTKAEAACALKSKTSAAIQACREE
jgi:hypothetical protein